MIDIDSRLRAARGFGNTDSNKSKDNPKYELHLFSL
jgi:hypothetical protein